jgi:hypothetical protein
MKAQAICGKLIEVEEGDPSVEAVCLRCPETSCETYVQYVYAVTHYNNPR